MHKIETPQSGDKPVLLLDVDGVFLVSPEMLAPDYKPQVCPEGFRLRPNTDNPYIFYNPDHGAWMRSLLVEADTYYLTSLGPEAYEEVGDHLGLPRFAWVNYWAFPNTEAVGERVTAVTAIFPGRAVVWVDDEHKPAAYAWAEERTANGTPTLLIQPESEQGLQYEHVVQAKAWLGQLTVR